MADLKPIGSEKLQGMEKIARIMEIARYGEKPKEEININESISYTKTLSDGYVYGIVKEKNGYILKRGINESSLDYMDIINNRKYYNSYSQAFKRLNLLAGEVNRLNENEDGTSLFGEEKKFVLKGPKTSAPPADLSTPPADLSTPPADLGAPASEVNPSDEFPQPGDSSGDVPLDDMGDDTAADTGDEMPSDEMGDEGEEVTFKMIQKLTGKLGQKLRTYGDENEMSAEDVKYVLNSVISAVDLSVLDENDLDEVITKLEGEEEGSETDIDTGTEEPTSEPSDEEVPLDLGADGSDEVSVQPEVGESYDGVYEMLGGMFESKVDKILSRYFLISENEKKENNGKKVKKFVTNKINKVIVVEEIKRLSETIEQELTAEFVLSENENIKFIGKTNKNNLVFDNNGRQIKISPKGVIL